MDIEPHTRPSSEDPDPELIAFGVELATGTGRFANPALACDCDWPPTVPDVPHRPWCASITGVHAQPPDEGWADPLPGGGWISGAPTHGPEQ